MQAATSTQGSFHIFAHPAEFSSNLLLKSHSHNTAAIFVLINSHHSGGGSNYSGCGAPRMGMGVWKSIWLGHFSGMQKKQKNIMHLPHNKLSGVPFPMSASMNLKNKNSPNQPGGTVQICVCAKHYLPLDKSGTQPNAHTYVHGPKERMKSL